MTALRSIALAVGAIALEVIALLLVIAGTGVVGNLTPGEIPDISYAARASLAVATLSLWLVTGGATVFMALRLGRRWLRVNLLVAVFIVAVINGPMLLFLLAYGALVNDCVWNVPFPTGGDQCGRFR